MVTKPSPDASKVLAYFCNGTVAWEIKVPRVIIYFEEGFYTLPEGWFILRDTVFDPWDKYWERGECGEWRLRDLSIREKMLKHFIPKIKRRTMRSPDLGVRVPSR